MKKYLKENWGKLLILLITIAINVFIIVNAALEGPKSSKISNSVGDTVINMINNVSGEEIISKPARPSFLAFFRKFGGHFCLFGLSGIFTTLSCYLFLKNTKLKNIFIILGISILIGFAIACISELIQIPTDGRVGSWKDIGIDTGGYFLGLLADFLVLLFVNIGVRNSNKKQA